MKAVTLSFHRFEGARDRAWAFGQMGLARAALRRVPGLGFFKLLGTGSGEGFTPKPDLGVYAVLGAWDNHHRAEEQLATDPVFRGLHAHARERWTLFLTPTRCWGRWAGQEPFDVSEAAGQGPVAVLTRATLKPGNVLRFWRRVPDISRRIGANADVLFKKGLGEVPMINQVTFSIWPDLDTMTGFAYGNGPHIDAIRRVRAEDWFREELYARFAIERSTGRWGGVEPLARAQGKAAA